MQLSCSVPSCPVLVSLLFGQLLLLLTVSLVELTEGKGEEEDFIVVLLNVSGVLNMLEDRLQVDSAG